MAKSDEREKMPSFWLNVFTNSKVNGAEYREDKLPLHTWSWPTDTFLQRRLRTVRAHAADERVIVAQNPTLRQPAAREDASVPQRQNSRAPRRPVDNANRPTYHPAHENGRGIEWDNPDERLNWLARPSKN